MNNAFPYPLYLVLSEKDCTHLHWLEVAEQAIKGGVDIVQLREKNCSFDAYLRKAKQLKELTDAHNIPLIINDAVDVAMEVQSWGIHVGRSDMRPSEITQLPGHPVHIGWSLEVIEQLDSNELKFVHHLGVSPVFSTPTKTNTITEWGLNGIRQLKEQTSIPLIAIGGIHSHNAKAVLEAGADSLAVVSAICGSKAPFEAAYQLKQIIHDTQQTV
ncbi:MAG: thiamine phosphate synthase [Crocinitomicaceae bacterium]|nr:thiamine phosphate synthase [Crocinitomicaceae bacterium]